MRPSIFFATLLLASCSSPPEARSPLAPRDLRTEDWKNVVARARGTDVSFAMWSGEEPRNALFRGPITATLKEKYDINLRIVPSDTVEIVNKLINEKSAGRHRGGSVDMVWINGENFASPGRRMFCGDPSPTHSRTSLSIWKSREAATSGHPSKDGSLAARPIRSRLGHRAIPVATGVARSPAPMDQIAPWPVHLHRADFTGSVFVRHVLLHYGDGTPAFQKFDEDHYVRASSKAIAFLNDIKPYLWRKETYPVTLRELNRLFANGEVDFSMSYGPSFASVAIERGEFPASTRTFRFDSGTIGNYNFLAIPFNASNPPGALAVINHLMSFEQLLELSQVLKNLPARPLEADARPAPPGRGLPRVRGGTLSDTSSHRLPEPDATYLIRFEKDWQQQVLRK